MRVRAGRGGFARDEGSRRALTSSLSSGLSSILVGGLLIINRVLGAVECRSLCRLNQMLTRDSSADRAVREFQKTKGSWSRDRGALGVWVTRWRPTMRRSRAP
jgi:hypothetical protein